MRQVETGFTARRRVLEPITPHGKERMFQMHSDVMNPKPSKHVTNVLHDLNTWEGELEDYYRRQHRQNPTLDDDRIKDMIYEEFIENTITKATHIDSFDKQQWWADSWEYWYGDDGSWDNHAVDGAGDGGDGQPGEAQLTDSFGPYPRAKGVGKGWQRGKKGKGACLRDGGAADRKPERKEGTDRRGAGASTIRGGGASDQEPEENRWQQSGDSGSTPSSSSSAGKEDTTAKKTAAVSRRRRTQER